MTALENVTLAPRRVLRVPINQMLASAQALFEKFDLVDRINHYPYQLSGVQLCVAIIRAHAKNPQIMSFDEISSTLDPVLIEGVLDVLRALRRQCMIMR